MKFEFCMLKNTTQADFQLKISTPGIVAANRSSRKKFSKYNTGVNGFQKKFSQLSDMKKLMFHYNNFFDLGPFLTFHSNVMDQKMAGAKKVVKTKNQFFHACQLRKGIFEIHSHRCCILRTCFQIFYWLPLFQELKFSAKNQLVQCFSTCRIRISWLLLHLRVTGLH